jgi:hypothetical protein
MLLLLFQCHFYLPHMNRHTLVVHSLPPQWPEFPATTTTTL